MNVSVHIPEKYFDAIQQAGGARRLRAGENIFSQGDPAEFLYLVAAGRVRCFVLSQNGSETTLEILEKGRMFGDSSFLSGVRRCVTIQAVTDAEVIVCSTQKLVNLCHRSEELMLLLFQHMTETCNYLTHQVARLTQYDSRQKVIDFLLTESLTRGQNSLPYTHEEIAHSVGLNRVTVSRILADLKSKDMIACSYGNIELKDRNRLQSQLPEV